MIKPITIHTAICDSCGTDICNGTGFSGWDMAGIENELSDLDWVKVDLPENADARGKPCKHLTKHYCPKCYEYDENNKLILKEKQ